MARPYDTVECEKKRRIAPPLHANKHIGILWLLGAQNMTDADKALELAAEIRKTEIGLFWQRSLFFGGLTAAAFLAYYNIREVQPEIRFAILCIGIIFSLTWTLANRASSHWQDAWQQTIEQIEQQLIEHRLFKNPEPTQKYFPLWASRKYSVSKLVIALSDFALLIWIFLGLEALAGRGINVRPWRVMILLTILTIAYAGLMLWKAQTSPRRIRPESPSASSEVTGRDSK
jgi:hypothetical protein